MTIKQASALAAGLLVAAFANADPIDTDTLYHLDNHPDGNAAPPLYGLRLDGLTTGDQGDTFTFEFGDSDDPMTLFWDSGSNSIAISGSVFGGLNENGGYAEGAATTWDVTFIYFDIYECIDGSGICSNDGFGTIASDVFGSFDLVSETGNHSYAFQLDFGHRGFDGVSGWGWMNHCPSADNDIDAGDCDRHLYASDWLFTVKSVPEPGTLALFGLGLLGIGYARRRKSLA